MKKLKNSLILTLALSIGTTLIPSVRTNAEEVPPQINGITGITLDVDTGEVIYTKNIDKKMYPASVTKLMTSLLLAENKKRTDEIPYTEDAQKQPAFALRTDVFANLKIGDTMSAEDVMKSLLLFSANDAAYMTADAVGGSSDNFIKMMNDKAAKLNMKNTHFVTANGIDSGITDHLTTAYDLTILGRAAYKNEWVREVMGTKKDMITLSTGDIAYVENRNKLVGKDGNLGGKTGYTDKAGRCLVSLYERNGRKMIGVVMRAAYDANDSAVFNDMETMINWSYAAKKAVLTKKDTVVKTEELKYKPLKFFGPTKTIKVPLVIKKDVSYYDNEVNKQELKQEISVDKLDPWTLSTDKPVATLNVKQRETVTPYELYTTISKSDIISQNKGLYAAVTIAGVAVLSIVILLLVLIKKGLTRKKRY